LKETNLAGYLRGADAPLSSLSPSPRMERGIKGVRLTNNLFELFLPSRYNIVRKTLET